MFYNQPGSGGGPGGGGGGGGGGGPWGSGGGSGGGGGPWSGRGGGGNPPPDLEELLRRSQERLRRIMPGGFGSPRSLYMLGAVILFFWGLSGVYVVQPDEQGVELMFGRYVRTTQPGPNFWFPAPVGTVLKPKVTQTNQLTIGFRGSPGNIREVPQESHILSGDQNIVDIQFVVQWRISNAGDYLFNMRDPESTVKIAAESALREVVGSNPLTAVITNQRDQLAQQARELLQGIMDGYKAGVTILDLRIQKADPPKEVIDAFNDVQRAKQDAERLENEALAYRNDIIPRAKGDAARLVQNATAEKERLVKEAEGQAARFTAFYQTYVANKDITTRRMYLEAMQEVLSKSEKIIMDSKGGPGVVPYLPLPEIQRRSRGQASAPQ
ncbi:MAG: FtsH protease activity modulator HflK [Rhodospirillaceae bacterium]|nr:FtsH protease activity modulator HflK [Rhodospirillaceae bacterium]